MEKDYILVSEFFYFNQKYAYLLDQDNKMFFLKINEKGEYEYVSFEIFQKLFQKFYHSPNVLLFLAKNRHQKFIPRVLIGGVAFVLSVSLLNFFPKKPNNSNNSLSDSISVVTEYSTPLEYQDELEKYLSDSYFDEEQTIDTYKESTTLNYVYIYDMEYLDKAGYNQNVEADDLKDAVNNNSNISDYFKKLLIDYIDNLVSKYPNIEKRVFYENLKTLNIVPCTERELALQSLSLDSYACYRKDTNTMYVLDGYDFYNDKWALQVFNHETSHVLRNAYRDVDGKQVRVQFEDSSGFGNVIGEALDSVFSVRLYDESERDIAYQLQSNYVLVMLECLDNYYLDDYVNHNYSYFLNALNQHNQNEEAKLIMALVQFQYDDYHDKDIEVEQSQYYPIYDYLVSMYLNEHLDTISSEEDLNYIVDDLIEKITFDVPQEYNIDTNYIRESAINYYRTLGENSGLKK